MLLKPKSESKSKPLTVRISTQLAAELAEVRGLAEQRGLLFDVAEVCSKALQAALKQARAELHK